MISLTRSRDVALFLGVVGGAVMVVACKKSVDPSAFDAGAPTAVAAIPSAPDAVDAAAAPLAALADAAAVPVKHVAPPKPKGPNPDDLQECTNARSFCSSPNVTTNPRTKKMCETFKADCIAKGGHL